VYFFAIKRVNGLYLEGWTAALVMPVMRDGQLGVNRANAALVCHRTD